MAVQGNMTWIDWALLKDANGTIKLYSDTIHAVLLTSAQAITRSFVGSSADARYADLTGELTTANGYTVGGVALSGFAQSRATAGSVKTTWTAPTWTLTGGGITFKYMALVDWTTTNKDIIAYCDMDTGGGSVSPTAGLYAINPDATYGFLTKVQP